MKKRLFALPLVLVLLTVWLTPALAADVAEDSAALSDFPLVADEAELLTEEERTELTDRAESISMEYECGVYLCVVNEMASDDAYEYAKSIYQENELGYGEEKSGIMLMLSMAERDYALIAYGEGNVALTDYGREQMLDNEVLPLLGEDDYYAGFTAYLDTAEDYLSLAQAGTPFDVSSASDGYDGAVKEEDGLSVILCVAVPAVISLVFCLIGCARMKSARPQHDADDYIPEDGCKITYCDDQFLYQTESRVRIEQDDSDSGGTTIDSSGFSGSSGKF